MSISGGGTSSHDDSTRIASFRLTDEEARVANADIRTRGGGKDWVRRSLWVLASVEFVYGFIDPLIWHTGVIAGNDEFRGVGYALMAAALTWGCGRVTAGVETILRFTKSGIVCERPFSIGIPWKVVRGAFDDGDLIRLTLRESLRHPIPRHYVIPKRVLPDDGVALWQIFEASLIGKRMLIPSRSAPLKGRPAINATRTHDLNVRTREL